ncbi:predicted protein [Sparassis crispa]|uniref:WD40 repeat-like protein n=1 Tax=Sparassis crispa TaxID=139825 RepID=A0A401H1G6_9APHY|nr:predicted protein [Sparassis crispa]GBE88277.1 predicted protein [Sparassis crispa]
MATSDWLGQLAALQQRIDNFAFGKDEEDAGAPDDGGAANFVQLLREVCAVVRKAEASNALDIDAVVEKAYNILNSAVSTAYGEADLFDFLPSFAHDDEAAPLVKDTFEMPFGQGLMDSFMSFFAKYIKKGDSNPRGKPSPFPGPGRWEKSAQPHPNTTRLSRFRTGITVSVTEATPLANLIYQARCEVTDDNICLPCRIAVSQGGSCLAVVAAGGWKNRDPVLHYYHLGDDVDSAPSVTIEPGFAETAYALAMDEARQLIFVADSDRVKSFSWQDKGKLVHTLRSDSHSGPIAVLPNGRIVRAGKGSALVWDIDKLQRHADGKRVGKGKLNIDDVGRDNDNDEVERSTGSKPHAKIQFAEESYVPSVWHLHQPTGHMLCGESGRKDDTYGCVALDLEHGGKPVSRYLGHGGDVEDFSTSEGDANLFATAADDGYARLFDMRRPLPVLTLDSGKQSEFCSSVAFVHPDGVPTVFTGGETSQQIKMWDVRARAVVYELGTGNNEVRSMAWDAAHSTLFAATECDYVDRLGYHHEYRRARIPRWAEEPAWRGEEDEDGKAKDEDTDMDEDSEDEDEEEEDEDENDDEERCWPAKAFHGEDYYGYAFDAGEHRLYRYAFKTNADPKQLPVYGQATLEGMNSYW